MRRRTASLAEHAEGAEGTEEGEGLIAFGVRISVIEFGLAQSGLGPIAKGQPVSGRSEAEHSAMQHPQLTTGQANLLTACGT